MKNELYENQKNDAMIVRTSHHLRGYSTTVVVVVLGFRGKYREFRGITNEMFEVDLAREKKGKKRKWAFYNLIRKEIEFDVEIWVRDVVFSGIGVIL